MRTRPYVEEEPPTDRLPLDGDVTTMGSAGIAQLHHLRALEAALEPARAVYAETLVEQLRSLPSIVRRQVFAQVLTQHASLVDEPAVVELARELGISPSEMTGTATSAAYDRMEALLPVIAEGLAELELARAALSRDIGLPGARPLLPSRTSDMLGWLLDERVAASQRAEQLAHGLRGLVAHVRAVREAARESVFSVIADSAPATVAARTKTPSWWPRVLRDSSVLAAIRALHEDAGQGSALADLYARRFARAYAERVSERT